MHIHNFAKFTCLTLLALCAAQSLAAHTQVAKAPRLPFMRGMGFDGYYDGRYRTWMTQQSVYSGLVAKGFDHVRLPVDFRNLASYDSSSGAVTFYTTYQSQLAWGGTTYREAHYPVSVIDTVITNAINAGLYIVLDFHGWFKIDPTDAASTNQFIALWKAVAERYKDYPNKLIFELANEPNSSDFGNVCTMQKNTIREIRKTNPTRLILFDPGDSSQPWVLTQAKNPPKFDWVSLPSGDNNIAVVVHSYNPGYFTHQGEEWKEGSSTTNVPFSAAYRSTLKWDLDQCKLYMDGTGNKLVMNEFNVGHKIATHSDITDYLSMVTRFCESNNVPWAPWIYYSDPKGGFDCFSSYGENASMYDFAEAGLFPDLVVTDKFRADMFAKAVDITFSGYSGSTALSDFPVLVKLSESGICGFRYSDFKKPGGFDLCFTDANGKLLAHEIDTWNTNGVSTVWVKVPSLTSSTKIVARYGCAKPIVPKVESVWDSDYVGVWHMGEQKLPLADSSNVSRDVTSADGTGIGYGAAGIAGGAVDFGAADSARSVNMDDHRELDGFKKLTVEAWTKQASHAKSAGILSKRKQIGQEMSYYLYDNGTGTEMKYTADGVNRVSAGVALSPVMGQWNHQAFSLDSTATSSNSKGYLNGVIKGTASVTLSGGVYAGASELHVGNLDSFNATNFPGLVDEVRISKCVRSADWIQASYETVANPSFATYAVQGAVPPDPEAVVYGPLATNLYAKSMKVLFAGVQQGVTLTNFPVLVKLSTAISGFSYGDFARADGADLRFADSDGKLIPHEIDTWNTNGVSTVWVKVPSLTKDAAITAHYGYTGAGDPAAVDSKDVWDDGYVAVWHLGESALPMAESTGVSTPFASKTGTASYGASGAVGGSVDFTAAKGTEGYLTAADDDDLDGFEDFTVEMWTCQDSFYNANEVYSGTLVKRNARADNESWFTYQDKATLKPGLAYGNDATASDRTLALANSLPATGAWTHQAFVRKVSTSNVIMFMDGTNNSTTVKSSGAVFAGSAPLMLGGGGGQKSFPGKIDEVRISKIARSAAWIKATHDTVTDADFATYAVDGVEPIPDTDITKLRLKARTDKDNPIDYKEGDAIGFEFFIDGVEALPKAVRAKSPLYVIWKRTADDGATAWGTNAISLAERFTATTSLAIPGIVRMQGTLVGSDYQAIEYTDSSNNKKNITFGGGAGVATEKMQLSTVEPADFNQFWEEAKAKLAAVPMDGAELVEVFPKSSVTNTYRYYAAKIPCFGPHPVTGWLTVPKNAQPGTLAVKATFDGYSAAIAQPSLPTDKPGTGTILFHVNAHGYDMVGHDAQYYKDFTTEVNGPYHPVFPGSSRPYSHGLAPQDYANPTNAYLYYMALRVVRAFDYLKSRSEWNGVDVIAEGGSQGGLQTMWAGSLVDGISNIRPYITWGCDIGNSLNASGPFLSNDWGLPNVPGAYYFDAALHAKRVPRTCVAEITRVGLSDYTSPPRGVLLSYYNMKCAVSAKLVQGSDHSDSSVPPQPNQVFTITKAAEAAAELDMDAFSKKMTVTFSGAQSGTTLTDFPVLVKLSTAIPGFSYADFAQADGGDLRFADANGNLLSHEIDTWDTSGVSTVWVKVPSLTKDATITACYGFTNGTPPVVDSKGVWDADYLGVWHLGAEKGVSVQPDSSSNGKNFGIHTNNSDGVASGADGVVGRSASTGLRTDGKGCFFQSDADKLFVNQTAFTVEAWTWQDDHEPAQNPTLRYVLAHSGGSETSYDWRIYENNKGKLVMQFNSLGSLSADDAKIFADDGAVRPARAAWNHTAFAWDGSSGQIGLYLGGNQLALGSGVASKNWTGTMTGDKTGFNLGNHRYDNTKSFKGRIDEVRISKVARSAAWIKATHDTIADTAFATYAVVGAPTSGYAAWIAEKGISGANAAADKVTNGIANGVRYAFDIDPQTAEIGTPIIDIGPCQSGNLAVKLRALAEGRSDVTYGVLATESLDDWTHATFVPYGDFADGTLTPAAVKNPAPAQMFFKYRLEIQ